MKEIIDFRTEKEKERDSIIAANGERFKHLMTMPHATAQRVISFMAAEEGITFLAMRTRLIKSGAFIPKKRNGNRTA